MTDESVEKLGPPVIAYLCDGHACEKCNPELCQHTCDITHAVNFERIPGTMQYFEKVKEEKPMLIENNNLYEALESALRAAYGKDEYVFAHAIYEPDDDGGAHEAMYHAAADLHEPGKTYHVYFVVNDDDSIVIDTVERWFMG